MNTKLFLIAVVIVAAFGIAAMVGPATIATQAVAQNMTGDNASMMAGNYTADNNTGGNWTK
jgi:L-cystine uptake protein TcyP (sodium:dicarboxylate symporter family)